MCFFNANKNNSLVNVSIKHKIKEPQQLPNNQKHRQSRTIYTFINKKYFNSH